MGVASETKSPRAGSMNSCTGTKAEFPERSKGPDLLAGEEPVTIGSPTRSKQERQGPHPVSSTPKSSDGPHAGLKAKPSQSSHQPANSTPQCMNNMMYNVCANPEDSNKANASLK